MATLSPNQTPKPIEAEVAEMVAELRHPGSTSIVRSAETVRNMAADLLTRLAAERDALKASSDAGRRREHHLAEIRDRLRASYDKAEADLSAQHREIERLQAIVSATEAERYAKCGALAAQIAALEQSNTVLGEQVQQAESALSAANARAEAAEALLDRAEKVLGPIAARCAEAVRPDDADSAGVTVRSEHLRAAAELRAELTKDRTDGR